MPDGSMRVYFIHVYRRHWEFYPDEQAEDSLVDQDVEVTQSGWMVWLRRKITSTWHAVERPRPDGTKSRLRKILDTLNSRVDPTEPMLRRFRKAPEVVVTYPSGISPQYARRRLRLLLLNKTASHRRWMIINGAMLPLTAAMTLLPGPNVFFAWNGYRLLAHLFALRGGQRVLSGQVAVTFMPNEELNELLAPEERLIKPLEQDVAHSIGQRFKLPGLVEYLKRNGCFASE